jgi:hypothetical protein
LFFVSLWKTFIMASRMLFGRGWYSTLPMLLISMPCDTPAEPGTAFPAFLGDDASLSGQFVSTKNDERGTDQEFQP